MSKYDGQGYIAKVMPEVYTDGEGIRVSVYVSGCTFHCKDCFNASIWGFNKGRLFDELVLDEIIHYLKKPYIQGLSILGGEPLQNLNIVKPLIKRFRKEFGCEKDIWMWSGYMKEFIERDQYLKLILDDIDVLIDGPFVYYLKDLSLKFRGSHNQRINYLSNQQ